MAISAFLDTGHDGCSFIAVLHDRVLALYAQVHVVRHCGLSSATQTHVPHITLLSTTVACVLVRKTLVKALRLNVLTNSLEIDVAVIV